MNTALETDRLILTTLTERDANRVLAYEIRNRAFLSDWDPLRSDAYFTLEQQRCVLKQMVKEMEAGTRCSLGIGLKGEDRLIGMINFTNIVRGCFLSCFAGYRLDEQEINKGYMTEALTRAVRYAFDNLKLHRVEANIIPRNIRSRRVAEKAGFECEGTSREYLKINGVWEDHMHYVRLNRKMPEPPAGTKKISIPKDIAQSREKD